MTTGAFWDLTNPLKPVGRFDPDSVLDIPFDWTDWLTQEGTAYDSHLIIVADSTNMECVSSAEDAGIITARIKQKAGGALVLGQKYAVTCRITDDSGQVEDMTVWLKIAEK